MIVATREAYRAILGWRNKMKTKQVVLSVLVFMALGSCVSKTLITPTEITKLPSFTNTKKILENTDTIVLPTTTEDIHKNDKYYLSDCWDKAKYQNDLNQCAGLQEQGSYQALQNLLIDIQKMLDVDGWNQLQDAQLKWEEYRNSDCEFLIIYYGRGSMAPMAKGLCLHNHNVDRINKLKDHICEIFGGISDQCKVVAKY